LVNRKFKYGYSKDMELVATTNNDKDAVDITDQVQELVSSKAKAVTIFTMHTTCSVTTADLDPGTDKDLLSAVWEMIPKLEYRHPHNPEHVPAHLASSIIGPSVTVPVDDGRLVLGAWQRIILVELDGPRERNLIVTNL
jgi:secondary thiamine-phosphate synthase enzyme